MWLASIRKAGNSFVGYAGSMVLSMLCSRMQEAAAFHHPHPTSKYIQDSSHAEASHAEGSPGCRDDRRCGGFRPDILGWGISLLHVGP